MFIAECFGRKRFGSQHYFHFTQLNIYGYLKPTVYFQKICFVSLLALVNNRNVCCEQQVQLLRFWKLIVKLHVSYCLWWSLLTSVSLPCISIRDLGSCLATICVTKTRRRRVGGVCRRRSPRSLSPCVGYLQGLFLGAMGGLSDGRDWDLSTSASAERGLSCRTL